MRSGKTNPQTTFNRKQGERHDRNNQRHRPCHSDWLGLGRDAGFGAVQMSMKHTPGPWHVEPEKDRTYVMAGVFYITDTVECAGEESDDTTQHANARLIAAAPDLLNALKTAKWMLERDYIDDQKMRVIEKCDAAIAKATAAA